MKKNTKTSESKDEKIFIEENKYTLDLINNWITSADQKISISCGLSTVVFTILSFGAEKHLSGISDSKQLSCYLVVPFYFFVIVAIVMFLSSLVFYYLALMPNLTTLNSSNDDLKYSLFYGDIAKYCNSKEFVNATKKITKEKFNVELLKEIYTNSKICNSKMINFKKGMMLSVGSIISVVVASVIYYIGITFM